MYQRFDSFAELEWYMERYWHIMETGDLCIVGHEMGQLTLYTPVIVTMELQQGNWDIGLIQYGRSIAMIMECLMSHLKILMNFYP